MARAAWRAETAVAPQASRSAASGAGSPPLMRVETATHIAAAAASPSPMRSRWSSAPRTRPH